jgi:hypothetical protein
MKALATGWRAFDQNFEALTWLTSVIPDMVCKRDGEWRSDDHDRVHPCLLSSPSEIT